MNVLLQSLCSRLALDEFECPTTVRLPVGSQEKRRGEPLFVEAHA